MSALPDIRYIFVEANVAAGKTTLIERVEPVLRDLFAAAGAGLIAVPEPIGAWTDVGGHNVLEAFYQDKQRYAALFQSHALVTRVQAINMAVAAWSLRHPAKEGAYEGGASPVLYVLCERSIFTDRHVFVEALRQDGSMTDMQVAVYRSWWEFWEQRLYPGVAAAVVHLQASPTVCAQRMRQRDRIEETDVPVAYLELLDQLHDAALARSDTWRGAPRLALSVAQLGNVPTDDAAVARAAQAIYQFVRPDAPAI